MSRSLVSLREATLADAEHARRALAALPAPGSDEQLHDLATAIEQLGDRPGERLVVAEYDGDLRRGSVPQGRAPYSPINPEPVLQVHNAAVVPAFRRRGIGKALVESAVTWAEELGIGHVATARVVRLARGQPVHGAPALGPQAVLRMAPTPAVRAKLTPRNPSGRQVTQVLAVRRSLRHARSTSRSRSPAHRG